jgi:hypothetical protein
MMDSDSDVNALEDANFTFAWWFKGLSKRKMIKKMLKEEKRKEKIKRKLEVLKALPGENPWTNFRRYKNGQVGRGPYRDKEVEEEKERQSMQDLMDFVNALPPNTVDYESFIERPQEDSEDEALEKFY